jgi:co-chaperonin GroES (HSP10)
MSVTSVRKLSDIAEAIGKGKDARTVLVDAIGADNIENFEPFHNLVLVGTYVRSDMTKGGIIIGGDRTRAEDRFQGKIGLVLKVGPTAFKGVKPDSFGGVTVEPGDWIMYKASDAHEFFFVDEKSSLDGSSVRLVEDTLIMGRVADPESIF